MGYTPRRANLKRWLAEAPAYVLDCFDSKGPGDRYTVLFTRPLTYSMKPDGSGPTEGPGEFAHTYVQYLGMNDAPTHPQGISMWGEMNAYEAAAYRHRVGHQRVRWLDLPEHIRKHVISRAA